MPATALALALAAAVLHAFWNVLVARSKDPEAAAAVSLLIALLAVASAAGRQASDVEQPCGRGGSAS